jgi:predicted nucleic acid-binding Zn ribbon protein
MDSVNLCPVCHQPVEEADYFCRNCGRNLRKKPLSTSAGKQILVYLGSIFLFPLGFIWGIRYIREYNRAAKTTGLICLIISVLVLFAVIYVTFMIISGINNQVNQQLQIYQGL